MRIIARRTLREFWEAHPDAEEPLRTWYTYVRQADWQTPSDVKSIFRTASFVGNDRVVFNIKGNRYRLVVVVVYRHHAVYIRFIGTHREYNDINVATV
jgi:mRNA interferase HigB